jgi:hypothetical protein
LLIFIHIEHTFCICPFLVTFFSATIDGRNLIFGHKLHIGTPYRGKRFLTCQIPTSCLPKSGGIINEHKLTVHLVFIRLSLRQNILWYTTVHPSVHPFHMSRSYLRTPWPIHFKFHRVIGIDGLTVCILYGEILIFFSFLSYGTLFIKL